MTDDRKIVRTVSLTLSSAAYDADYAAVLALMESAGGYVSSVSAVHGAGGKPHGVV